MDKLGYNSLEEVASELGINRGNLYRYFTLENRPSIAMLPIFCKVLKVKTDEVLRALEVA
jgi:transcriptional regulator with XRE-family HTH domain